MPFRASRETEKSLFSRTLHARNGKVVRIEHHQTPAPMAPQWTTPPTDTSTPMACDWDGDGPSLSAQDSLPGEEDFLGPAAETDDTHKADKAYAKLVAEMMEEPLPPDSVTSLE